MFFSVAIIYCLFQHIYKYLLHQERTLKRPKYGYMDKQPDLSFKMRSILIDWLSSVTEEYNLHPQTFHLAVHYLDTFLSRMSVVKQKFQLVGTAAMFIASKYEEIYPPDAKEFVYLTADTYTVRQLRKMEQLILKVLQFDLAQPTTFAFIIHLGTVLNLTMKTTLLAMVSLVELFCGCVIVFVSIFRNWCSSKGMIICSTCLRSWLSAL